MLTKEERAAAAAAAQAERAERAWQADVAALYDTDSLFYALCLIDEGYGEMTPHLLPLEETQVVRTRAEQRRAEMEDFARDRRARLARLIERRPEEGRAAAEAWEAWWTTFCR